MISATTASAAADEPRHTLKPKNLVSTAAQIPAPRPDLIFADEPTGNLDAATGEEIINLLFARRAETGATLLIITHDASLAARCERVLTMADGVIVSDTANPQ